MVENKTEAFYTAWYFIQQHPRFMNNDLETFPYGLDIAVVKVNPQTMGIEDNDTENTVLQVWLEYGPYEWDNQMVANMPTHDITLDCGADTFENAIIELAGLIRERYGDYELQER